MHLVPFGRNTSILTITDPRLDQGQVDELKLGDCSKFELNKGSQTRAYVESFKSIHSFFNEDPIEVFLGLQGISLLFELLNR